MNQRVKRGLSGFLALVMVLSLVLSEMLISPMKVSASANLGNGPIDVWDFGGVLESDTSLYTNHIQASDWNNQAAVITGGKFVAVDNSLQMNVGDLAIDYVANDRLYVNDTSCNKSYGTWANSVISFEDGYTSNGTYYCNGTGGAGRRCVSVNQVKAGDRVTVYMGVSNAVEYTMAFQYLGTDGEQLEKRTASKPGKFEFVADYDGSYKFYTETVNGAKPVYYRVIKTPGILVSGTIDLADTGATGYTVTFTNATTGKKTEAKVNGTEFSVTLAPGYNYTAVMSGVTGVGFTNTSKQLTLKDSDLLTGKNQVVLTAEKKTTYVYSGKITGFDKEYDLTNLAVKLLADPESNSDDIELAIGENLEYSAICEPDVMYTLQISGVNDYEITKGGTLTSSVNIAQDIVVEKKAVNQVSGGYLGMAAGTEVKTLTFINEEDGYQYAAKVGETGYSVSLRDGAYRIVAEADGYTTNTHVVVKGKDVVKDLLFVSTDNTIVPIERANDIYVGYEGKEHNYDTMKEAVAVCKAMNPTSEEERITVHIAPGIYREQILINTPYVSFVNDDPKKEVKLTWYYGIGYKYYSCDQTGFYNAENAYDQYSKAIASKWGTATYVQANATGFRAENIVFEASFNRYITDEELEDGVELTGNESITAVRKYGLDVASKAATERAAALCVDADNTEFYNCTFLGSQDTLYTGGYNTSSYYKNCVIEGNTDYIFGDGDVVFDGCELKWYGYTSNSAAGYITAAKSAEAKNGYVFRNCAVTGNTNEKVTVTPGYFGRPWGAGAKVTFVNTKLGSSSYLNAAGWTDMSGNTPQNASFTEFNTTVFDGTKVDTSKRVTGVTANDPQINVSNYFGDWTPHYYSEENKEVSFTTLPYVVDNGDLNAPYPGHKLTMCYSLGENDANDASTIQWYRVSSDGTEKLVKSSTAVVDATYTITKEDQGSYIKGVVIPETFSGNKGTKAEYQVEAIVKEGYDNPDAGEGDVELGDGVNIFLAGDSTVKDYSVNGMYNNGIAQSLGSWGEFIQNFFDQEKVNIVNYANGGRSTRNFINEGSLDKIVDKIGEGDYLFIQFGHNDCANGQGYLEDRYVPLGTPDANGIYPVTAGVKVATPTSLADKYGSEFYSYDCGGTYKWYLQQYIDAAKNKGAIPVLVTPVSRMYYNADGSIKPHHDSTDTTTNTYVSSNDAYVTAVKQLASEQNVLLVDGFELTKKLYEETYKADAAAKDGVSPNALVLMGEGDKTHSSKLGGFISAAYIAQYIESMDLNISKAVVKPAQVSGVNPDGTVVFNVTAKHVFTAYDKTAVSAYWTQQGQALIDAIGNVAPTPEVTPTVAPTTEPTETPVVTEAPTETPVASAEPTVAPTAPAETPTVKPTVAPTNKPVVTPVPTVKPTTSPAVTVNQVTKVKVKATTSTKVTISWKSLKGVTGYQVKAYKGNKLVSTKEVKANYTSTTISKLSNNTAYRFKVRAYKEVKGKRYYGKYSTYVNATTKLKTPAITVKKGTKKANVSWKKVSGAKGYEVVMSTKKTSNFKKVKTVTKNSSVKVTISNLKSGKTYYFKVRAYKVVNGKKVYSNYSTVKSVKVK